MVTRIVVRSVVFLFVCLSSMWGQQFEAVRLSSGWSARHAVRQVTENSDDFSKCSYFDAAGKDITAKLINPQTGRVNEEAFRKLLVGTEIRIPASLVSTKEVAAQGKTLRQLCAENKTWNCRKVEVSNHIRSMQRPLVKSVRVPKTEVSTNNQYQDFSFIGFALAAQVGLTREFFDASLHRVVRDTFNTIYATYIATAVFTAIIITLIFNFWDAIPGAFKNAKLYSVRRLSIYRAALKPARNAIPAAIRHHNHNKLWSLGSLSLWRWFGINLATSLTQACNVCEQDFKDRRIKFRSARPDLFLIQKKVGWFRPRALIEISLGSLYSGGRELSDLKELSDCELGQMLKNPQLDGKFQGSVKFCKTKIRFVLRRVK